MRILLFVGLLITCIVVHGQDRIAELETKLKSLSTTSTGLNDTVDFSVTGVSLQEFLRGLAENSNLNISVDPSITAKVYNNFTNEKVINIILFLCKEYQLDIRFVGTIMSFYNYIPPEAPKVAIPKKELKIFYDKNNDLLSLDLQNDTLAEVVKKITSLSGKNVVLAPNVTTSKQVSVFIRGVEFESAIDKLAFTSGMILEKTRDDFFILKQIEETAGSSSSSSRRSSRVRNNRSSSSSAGGGDYYLEVIDSVGQKWITFKAVDVPIADAINGVSEELEENYFMFSEPSGNTTSSITNVSYENFLGYILQGSEHTFKKSGDIYLIGERKLEGLRETKVIQLQYRSFEEVMQVIPAELKQGVEISEFKDLNSFILSGSSPQIAEISAFIKEIDKTVPMITIEVILMEVRRGKTLSTGIRAGKGGDSTAAGGTLLPGINFTLSSRSVNDILDRAPLNLGRVTPDFYLALEALDQQENVNVRSTPKLATLNGHEASLSIGQTRYYVIEQQNFVGTLNPNLSVTRNFQSVQADLSVDITPIVSGDEQVTLDVDVQVSDFLGQPSPDAPPNSTTSQFTSMVRVKNEEMVLLGGLERIEKSESGEGVPFLSRIPIIKWFFSSRSKTKSKSVYIVFIKPTIFY